MSGLSCLGRCSSSTVLMAWMPFRWRKSTTKKKAGIPNGSVHMQRVLVNVGAGCVVRALWGWAPCRVLPAGVVLSAWIHSQMRIINQEYTSCWSWRGVLHSMLRSASRYSLPSANSVHTKRRRMQSEVLLNRGVEGGGVRVCVDRPSRERRWYYYQCVRVYGSRKFHPTWGALEMPG